MSVAQLRPVRGLPHVVLVKVVLELVEEVGVHLALLLRLLLLLGVVLVHLYAWRNGLPSIQTPGLMTMISMHHHHW